MAATDVLTEILRLPAEERARLALELVDYYESRRPGLGDELEDEIDAVFAMILRFPEAAPQWKDRVGRRVAALDRFPFTLPYQLVGEGGRRPFNVASPVKALGLPTSISASAYVSGHRTRVQPPDIAKHIAFPGRRDFSSALMAWQLPLRGGEHARRPRLVHGTSSSRPPPARVHRALRRRSRSSPSLTRPCARTLGAWIRLSAFRGRRVRKVPRSPGPCYFTGDQRPMAENPHAFAELRALMTAREKLYARAEHTVETAGRRVPQVVSAIAEVVA